MTFTQNPTFGGAAGGGTWLTDTRTSTMLKIIGPTVASGTGLFNVNFDYPAPTTPVPAFSFQWAEVFYSTVGNTRSLLGSGTLSFSNGQFTGSGAFTHFSDIAGTAFAGAPVPLPSSVVLLLSALVFVPGAKNRRAQAA
jgi:hypothetical protein